MQQIAESHVLQIKGQRSTDLFLPVQTGPIDLTCVYHQKGINLTWLIFTVLRNNLMNQALGDSGV